MPNRRAYGEPFDRAADERQQLADPLDLRALGSFGTSGGGGGGLPLGFQAPGTITSQGVSGTVGGVGAGAGAAAGAAGGLAGAIKAFLLNPQNLLGLAGVIGGLASGRGGGTGGASDEQLRRLQQITEQRMQRVDPLHQAVTQLAWGRLPIRAREGIAPPVLAPLGLDGPGGGLDGPSGDERPARARQPLPR